MPLSTSLKALIDRIVATYPKDMQASVRAALLSTAESGAQGEQLVRQKAIQQGILSVAPGLPLGEGESGEEFPARAIGGTPPIYGTSPAETAPELRGYFGIKPKVSRSEIETVRRRTATATPTAQQKREAELARQWKERYPEAAGLGATPSTEQTPTRFDVLDLIRQGKLDEAEWMLLTIGVYDEETNPDGMNETEYSTLDLAIERARKRTTTATGAGAGRDLRMTEYEAGALAVDQERLKFQREQERNTILYRMQELQQEIADMRLTAAQNAIPPGLNYVPGTEPGGFLATNPYHRGGQVPLVSTPFTPPPMPTLQQLGGY